MDKFLEMYNFPILNLKEIENTNMNRLITSNEIESVILKIPNNKIPGQDGLRGEFY